MTSPEDLLYAITHDELRPTDLTARLDTFSETHPESVRDIKARFLLEVMRIVASRGGPSAQLARDALTVIGGDL